MRPCGGAETARRRRSGAQRRTAAAAVDPHRRRAMLRCKGGCRMRDKRFDVVVAGCGVAGLSAAVAAAEAGARVAVLERAPREERGGQSRYTEAYLRMKSESEVTDDFVTQIAENCSGYLDPELVEEASRDRESRVASSRALSLADPDFIETFAEEAGPTVAW